MRRIITPTGALRAWWSIFMLLLAAVLVAGSCIVYTNYAQRESDRRWCSVLTTLDAPGAPPTTERARQIQQQIHELRHSLGCGGVR